MSKNPMTHEEIEAHLDAFDFTPYQEVGPTHVAAIGSVAPRVDPAAQLSKACGIYRGVRPIINGLATFFFVPAKWRTAILTFMNVMDQLCPNVQP